MTVTKKANLVNTVAFADSVSAKLGDAIKLMPLAFVQNFEGEPAGSISVPTFKYIGDAEEMVEGTALDPVLLTQTSVDVEVVQAGKAVEITDKAVKSAYGDPIGEAESQVVKAIASKVEKDMFTALATSTLKYTGKTAEGFDTKAYFGALELFGEDQEDEHYIVVNPDQTGKIKTNINFGEGKLVDAPVIFSNRVAKTKAYLVKPEALGLYLAKDVEVEEDRDILKKTSLISGSELYATHLRDDSKVVAITFGA
ncbi:MAG: hypothetical protein WBA84_03970 [Carnobacterium sp.]|uniref:phage major capsid protein n=1 Tax=Carnobacterium sp. TaxID=48221 RepID=UPI003C76E5B5